MIIGKLLQKEGLFLTILQWCFCFLFYGSFF